MGLKRLPELWSVCRPVTSAALRGHLSTEWGWGHYHNASADQAPWPVVVVVWSSGSSQTAGSGTGLAGVWGSLANAQPFPSAARREGA